MKIENYQFGRIVVDGQAFSKDLILSPSGIHANWWRKEGHRLAVDDIREIVEKEAPEILVVGTGKFGMMKVLPETERYLAEKGVRLIAKRTSEAAKQFNELADEDRVVGAFHLTC